MNKEILEAVLKERTKENEFIERVIDEALVDKVVDKERDEESLKGLKEYFAAIRKKEDKAKETAKRLAKEAKRVNQDPITFLSLFLNEFCDNDSDESTWKIDSALDQFITSRAIKIIDPCIELHRCLVKDGYTEENPYYFLDNHMYYLETDPIWYKDSLVSDRKVFVFKGQSFSWIIIIDISGNVGVRLHIRQFADSEHLELPYLDWYKEIGFTPDISCKVSHNVHMGLKYSGYGDCRDKGYILSVDDFDFKSDSHNYYKAKFAIDQIKWAISQFSL